jgi:phenylacetate-CoA ligase
MRNWATVLLARHFGYEQPETEHDPAALLAGIVRHAYLEVPYYQALFDRSGIVRGGEVDTSRFNEIPFLDKQALIDRGADLVAISAERRKTFWTSSGGSTGEPTRILQDKEYVRAMRGIIYRQKRLAGYRFGEPMVKLWGDEREVLRGSRTMKAKMVSRFKGVTWLNSFIMSPQRMRGYIETINRIRPKLIVAYAHAMYELAVFAREENLSMRRVGAIITSAGTLYPFMRETIEQVCGAPVFNRYGSREVGAIAIECSRHEGMHIASDIVHVEVVDEYGQLCPPGVEGEMVVTTLVNRVMPLIRYRIGDRGVMSGRACSCGRPGPLLAQVTGRVTDVFRTRSGAVIPPEYFIHMVGVVLNTGRIRKFQVVQKDYDQVLLRIVRGDGPVEQNVEQIADAIRKAMGGECGVAVEYVNDIPPLLSGKYRYTIRESPP